MTTFTNFILADEINRAPPKVQSALLEAMQEKQVSIQGETHKLHSPFMVLATQNPIEAEGSYNESSYPVCIAHYCFAHSYSLCSRILSFHKKIILQVYSYNIRMKITVQQLLLRKLPTILLIRLNFIKKMTAWYLCGSGC